MKGDTFHRRIRTESERHEFDAMVRREMVDSPHKFMLITICYPIFQFGVYIVTGDIVALSVATVLLILWIVMLYCFVELFKGTDDFDNEIAEARAKKAMLSCDS